MGGGAWSSDRPWPLFDPKPQSARTIQCAYIPSAGRRWFRGVPRWKFSITTSARSDQVACERTIIGAFEVQHDAALAALQYGIGRMPPPGPARRVDADDLGALVGQQQCRQRSDEILAETDDADAVQCRGFEVRRITISRS
jgi:hypothetical protein